MDANLDFAGGNVVNETHHSVLHRAIISGFLNIASQGRQKLSPRGSGIDPELQAFVPSLLHKAVDVYSYKDTNLTGA